MPVASVIIDCSTAGPEEIETMVLEDMEAGLMGLDNLDTLTSRASEGGAIIMLEFDYGTDIDDATEDIDSVVSMLQLTLPDWVESVTVLNMNSISSSNIMRYMLVSDEYTLAELQEIGENDIAPIFERVAGVSDADTTGGGSTAYLVEADPAALSNYGVTLSDLMTAIANSEAQQSTGELETGDTNYKIAVDGRYRNTDDILQTVVANRDGRTVRVGDVATVSQDNDDDYERSYYNGQPVVTISIYAESDFSETTVSSNVKEAIPEIEAALPHGVSLVLQTDSTEMITDTMGEVANSLMQGIVLAALIIFVFLRGIKSTIFISLSMPVCVLITLMCMSLMDLSINMMTMSGLILGIGMIVDASIIILENTYSYRLAGEKSAISAILGSKNMFNAILASTLTTVCVFLPLLIYKYDLEAFGVMFEDLIYVVCIALLSSLFVSVTLVPALCGSILKLNTRTQKPLKNKLLRAIDNAMERAEDKMRDVYAAVLDYFLDHKLLLITILLCLLCLSIVGLGNMGISLTPDMSTDDEVTLDLELPDGTDNSVTAEWIFDMQVSIIATLPEGSYESISLEVGESNTGSITIKLPDITEQTISASEVTELIRPLTEGAAAGTWVYSYGGGAMMGSAIDIEIRSDSTDLASETATQIMEILGTYVPQATDLESDITDGAPRLELQIDRDAADDLGVTNSEIISVLSTAFDGKDVAELTAFRSGESYDVTVQLDDTGLTDSEQILALEVNGANGRVPLYNVASFTYDSAPKTITREDGVRVNHVEGDVAEGYSSSEVQSLVNEALDQYLILPDGVTITQSGDMSEFAEYGPAFVMASSWPWSWSTPSWPPSSRA